MAKQIMTQEQITVLKKAQTVLEKIEEALEETEFEFVIEGENMFIRTMDEKNVFRVYDKSIGGTSMQDSVLMLPRTTDTQDLIPVILDGKDWR